MGVEVEVAAELVSEEEALEVSVGKVLKDTDEAAVPKVPQLACRTCSL